MNERKMKIKRKQSMEQIVDVRVIEKGLPKIEKQILNFSKLM